MRIVIAATSTYTACGRDTDWKAQAEHFIAASCAAAALAPESHLPVGTGPAWKAAIQARMTQNCLMMEDESSDTDNEALKQYRITDSFLDSCSSQRLSGRHSAPPVPPQRLEMVLPGYFCVFSHTVALQYFEVWALTWLIYCAWTLMIA